MGLKVFKILPSYIKNNLQDIKEFKWLIKNFLYCNTFYTLDEYFNYNKKKHIMKIFNISNNVCLSYNSYASACLITILIVQLFLCFLLLYSYYSSIWYWYILTIALGYSCKGNCVYFTNSLSDCAVIVTSEDCWYMKWMMMMIRPKHIVLIDD